MRITEEWAKQLIFFTWGNTIDYSTVNLFQAAPGIFTFRIPIVNSLEWVDTSVDPHTTPNFGIEEINLDNWYDPINQEITPIGYGSVTNSIVVGETTRAEHPPNINPMPTLVN